jgi:cytolethal distending toxin subunit B
MGGIVKVATWNMQGANFSTEDKWNNGVQALLRSSEAEVACLQEAGAVPKSAKLEATSDFTGPGGVTCKVEIYSWANHRLVYYWWGDRCNVGVITRELMPVKLEVGLVWGSDGPEWRPAVGIRLPSGTWVFSLHAISPNGPDAKSLVEAVKGWARGRPWIAAGDFNREPGSFTVADSTTVPPNNFTHKTTDPKTKKDYLVAGGAVKAPAGDVKSLVQSDHFPVIFTLP